MELWAKLEAEIEAWLRSELEEEIEARLWAEMEQEEVKIEVTDVEATPQPEENVMALKERMRLALLNKLKPSDNADQAIGPKIECIKQVVEGEIGTYTIGGKKTSAKMVNGNLLIKVGGGWEDLDSYIDRYVAKN